MIGFSGPPAVPPALPTEMDETRSVKDPEKTLAGMLRRVFRFLMRLFHRLRR